MADTTITSIPATVTESDLADWLTSTVGDSITNDYDTARNLIRAFDLAAKNNPSLNNPQKVAISILTARNPDNEPFRQAPVTATKAATQLVTDFHITRKPDNHAQMLVDLPMPAVVTRNQCPFCRRYTRANAAAVQDHMSRCWQNPGLRCCKTCTHHQDASGTPGSPDEWLESCTHPTGPEWEDYRFPVLHCPLWESTKEADGV